MGMKRNARNVYKGLKKVDSAAYNNRNLIRAILYNPAALGLSDGATGAAGALFENYLLVRQQAKNKNQQGVPVLKPRIVTVNK